MDLQEMVREDSMSCCYGTTLPKDPTFTMPSSWTAADPSSFLIRGDKYLEDQKKVTNSLDRHKNELCHRAVDCRH